MKVNFYSHAILFKDHTIMLRPTDSRDLIPIKRLFDSKKTREERRGHEIYLEVSMDAPFQKRSIKELNTAFKLITCIFESQEQRKPTEEEKYALYEDLLTEYADKVPCILYPDRTRFVRLSEANTVQAAHFIDGLIYHLCCHCHLKQDLQADVREIIHEFETWRGNQDKDFTAGMNENEWRKRAVYSEASGIAGDIDLHHMISKGSNEKLRNNPENWIALNRVEHNYFHDHGETAFLQKYPHLEGRFKRAHELALEALEGEKENE